MWSHGQPQAKDAAGSGSDWAEGLDSAPQSGAQVDVVSRLSYEGTVEPADMDRATDARHSGRIGIFGSSLDYAGSTGEARSELLSGKLNPGAASPAYGYPPGEDPWAGYDGSRPLYGYAPGTEPPGWNDNLTNPLYAYPPGEDPWAGYDGPRPLIAFLPGTEPPGWNDMPVKPLVAYGPGIDPPDWGGRWIPAGGGSSAGGMSPCIAYLPGQEPPGWGDFPTQPARTNLPGTGGANPNIAFLPGTEPPGWEEMPVKPMGAMAPAGDDLGGPEITIARDPSGGPDYAGFGRKATQLWGLVHAWGSGAFGDPYSDEAIRTRTFLTAYIRNPEYTMSQIEQQSSIRFVSRPPRPRPPADPEQQAREDYHLRINGFGMMGPASVASSGSGGMGWWDTFMVWLSWFSPGVHGVVDAVTGAVSKVWNHPITQTALDIAAVVSIITPVPFDDVFFWSRLAFRGAQALVRGARLAGAVRNATTLGKAGRLASNIAQGRMAEERAAKLIGGILHYQRTANTPFGRRVIDLVSRRGIGYEIKSGFVRYSGKIVNQIVKDHWLRESGAIRGVEWWFGHGLSGRGADQGILDLLDEFKIPYRYF